MTYPTKPAAAYDYVSYQASYPTTPLPASNVAADYAGHKTSIDAIVDFLQIGFRSDGLLQSGSVDPQSLADDTVALIGGWTPRGTWLTATAYAVSDIVEYPASSGTSYVCVTAHTAGVFATDLAAGKWQLVSSIRVSDANTWTGLQTFSAGLSATTGAFSGAVTVGGALTVTGAAALNGGATATTATAGDNDTSVATTAFVQNEFALRQGRNLLINGDFSIDQRNEGASQTLTAAAAVAYTVDRWYASCTGANVTVQRVTGSTPNPYAIKFTGAASVTGVLLGQRVEAIDAGTLSGQTVYVSLQVKSSSLTSLTWTVYYANSADDFSAKTSLATGTISSISSTLATKTFSFSATSNVTTGICIEFTGGALLGTQTLQIENVQLEVNQVTAFERLPFATRLVQCQRYYEKTYDPGTVSATATQAGMVALTGFGSAGNTNLSVPYKVTKRTAPTLAFWDGNGNSNKTSYYTAGAYTHNNATAPASNVIGAGRNGFGVNLGALTYTSFAHYTASAEL